MTEWLLPEPWKMKRAGCLLSSLAHWLHLRCCPVGYRLLQTKHEAEQNDVWCALSCLLQFECWKSRPVRGCLMPEACCLRQTNHRS